MADLLNVGYVRVNEKDEKKYTSIDIDIPFLGSFGGLLFENKNKQNSNAPDYFIQRKYLKKNAPYRRVECGALWRKVSKSGNTYFSGYVSSLGKDINIFLLEPKVFQGEEASKIDWLYDVFVDKSKTAVNNTDSYEYR